MNPADAVVCWDLTPSGREGASGKFVKEKKSARTRNRKRYGDEEVQQILARKSQLGEERHLLAPIYVLRSLTASLGERTNFWFPSFLRRSLVSGFQ
jgi:hypothetical protein